MKKVLFTTILTLWVVITWAQIPAGYYSSADNKTGAALRTALYDRIKNHTVISYDDLEPYYVPTDFDSNGHLMDIYSTCTFVYSDGNKSQSGVCDAWNKEHTIPQSWFGESSPMKSDLFHVLPTDACVNGTRSNYPYGENASTGLGLKDGKDPDNHGLGSMGTNTFGGYSVGTVYEPDDQFKGDLARIYFYMMTRYMDKDFTKNSEGAKVFTYSNSQANFTDFAVNLFLKWHRQDPVSQKEINRNDSIYKVQKNRNPFVDYPYLVEYIWGDHKTEQMSLDQLIASDDSRFIPGESDGHVESTDPYLYSKTTSLTFPSLVLGQTSTLQLTFTGSNLTDSISCVITGANADCFSVSPTTITSANGSHTISVTYSPLTEALHSAVLTIASAGATSWNVTLNGACATECTVRWIVDGVEYTEGNPTTSVPCGGNITVLPTAPTSTCAQSETFLGWTSVAIDGFSGTKPTDLFTKASQLGTISSNRTYYAVFAHAIETTSSTPAEVTWTPSSSTGWTNTGLKSGSGYQVLIANASITSPEINLAALQKIDATIRTYGGTSYNKVNVTTSAGETIATFTAENSTLKSFSWTPTEALSGNTKLTFSSSTNTSTAGPGLSNITIISDGTTIDYESYTTSCLTTGLNSEVDIDAPSSYKVIRDGQLYIIYNGKTYNIFGKCIK